MKQDLTKSIEQVELSERIDGVQVGVVDHIDSSGDVFVDFPGSMGYPVAARFVSSLKLELLHQACTSKREVLLTFENGDPRLPIIIDTLHSYLDEVIEAPELNLQADEEQAVTVDGKQIAFDAKEQIVLRCGRSSITLTKAGKILIRGAYLLSRSSGVNRIKGGSVQIN